MKFLSTFYYKIVRETIIPLMLMITTPNVAVFFPYIIVHKKSNWIAALSKQSIFQLLKQIWSSIHW